MHTNTKELTNKEIVNNCIKDIKDLFNEYLKLSGFDSNQISITTKDILKHYEQKLEIVQKIDEEIFEINDVLINLNYKEWTIKTSISQFLTLTLHLCVREYIKTTERRYLNAKRDWELPPISKLDIEEKENFERKLEMLEYMLTETF